VRLDLEIDVRLPEGVVWDNGALSPECRRRAIEAALCSLPQQAKIYLDGEDAAPAEVWIDANEAFSVDEVRVE